jgi:hypothetical protein
VNMWDEWELTVMNMENVGSKVNAKLVSVALIQAQQHMGNGDHDARGVGFWSRTHKACGRLVTPSPKSWSANSNQPWCNRASSSKCRGRSLGDQVQAQESLQINTSTTITANIPP